MKFTELSTDVQESVIGKFCQWEAEEWDANDYVFPTLREVLGHLGYAIAHDTDGTREGFNYELGYGQGDYFALAGVWQAEDMNVVKLREEFPLQSTCWAPLHEIANELMAFYIKYPQGWIDVRHSGRRSMQFEGYANGEDREDTNELAPAELGVFVGITDRLCHWAFGYLRDAYESDTDGDAARATIEANDYDFDEHGAIIQAGKLIRKDDGTVVVAGGPAP